MTLVPPISVDSAYGKINNQVLHFFNDKEGWDVWDTMKATNGVSHSLHSCVYTSIEEPLAGGRQ